jgi:hypothetical protein
MIKKEKKKKESIFKQILEEVKDSIIIEVIFKSLLFIPRIIIRLIKNIT